MVTSKRESNHLFEDKPSNLTSNSTAVLGNSTDSKLFYHKRSQPSPAHLSLAAMALISTNSQTALSTSFRRREDNCAAFIHKYDQENLQSALGNDILTKIEFFDDTIEDGKISSLAKIVMEKYYGNEDVAVDSLDYVYFKLDERDDEKFAEIVKWLSYALAAHKSTSIVWLILKLTQSKSRFIRDASALALTEFAHLIPSELIEKPLNEEKMQYIKETLEYALKRSRDAETDKKDQ
ncbi:hypothetical protein ACFQDE_11340 [Deinococcus caeni]|uniref:hypothetical protein n=1 Tax=Deinococcus caeni TaxID=569127 RepID=UPI0031ED5DEC